MRRCRRSNTTDAAISLFSFQDIMSAVMGILILVTLMMALDLTVTVAQTQSQDAPSIVEVPPTRVEELKRLQAETDRLREQFDAAMERARRLAEIQGHEKEAVGQAMQALEEAYNQVNKLQDRVEEATTRLAEASRDNALQDLADEVSQDEAEIRRLQNILDQRRRHPRLTYIAQAGAGLQPILIELTDSRIGLATAENPDAAMWLTAQNRMQQFDRFIKGRDRKTEYFVILLKPSAFGQPHDRMRAMLESAGFAIGTELVGESVTVLPYTTE